MDREQKTAVVEKLTEELKDAEAIFAVDYRGISVPQAAELRTGLREADARFRVVKNRLTLRAADAAGTEALKEHLEGPTALTFVKGDAAQAAKTIFRLGSEWELLSYKGGLMAGEPLDADSFKEIARLPGRDQLNAQFAGIVASPLTGLVRGLGSMIQGLALQLSQIAEQGLVSGEAPPAEEPPAEDEAPAGEAPAEEEALAGPQASEESPPDPEPAESPEERTEEAAPEGEDAGQGEPDATGEGDQDIGEAPAPGDAEQPTDEEQQQQQEQASEDSDENKEEGE